LKKGQKSMKSAGFHERWVRAILCREAAPYTERPLAQKQFLFDFDRLNVKFLADFSD
jgi:hypothetical protein